MTAPSRLLTNKSAPLMIDHYDYNRKISLSRRDCSGTDLTVSLSPRQHTRLQFSTEHSYFFKTTFNETVVNQAAY